MQLKRYLWDGRVWFAAAVAAGVVPCVVVGFTSDQLHFNVWSASSINYHLEIWASNLTALLMLLSSLALYTQTRRTDRSKMLSLPKSVSAGAWLIVAGWGLASCIWYASAAFYVEDATRLFNMLGYMPWVLFTHLTAFGCGGVLVWLGITRALTTIRGSAEGTKPEVRHIRFLVALSLTHMVSTCFALASGPLWHYGFGIGLALIGFVSVQAGLYLHLTDEQGRSRLWASLLQRAGLVLLIFGICGLGPGLYQAALLETGWVAWKRLLAPGIVMGVGWLLLVIPDIGAIRKKVAMALYLLSISALAVWGWNSIRCKAVVEEFEYFVEKQLDAKKWVGSPRRVGPPEDRLMVSDTRDLGEKATPAPVVFLEEARTNIEGKEIDIGSEAGQADLAEISGNLMKQHKQLFPNQKPTRLMNYAVSPKTRWASVVAATGIVHSKGYEKAGFLFRLPEPWPVPRGTGDRIDEIESNKYHRGSWGEFHFYMNSLLRHIAWSCVAGSFQKRANIGHMDPFDYPEYLLKLYSKACQECDCDLDMGIIRQVLWDLTRNYMVDVVQVELAGPEDKDALEVRLPGETEFSEANEALLDGVEAAKERPIRLVVGE